MKKIVFYTETEWAFGTIHYELTKYLFAHNVNASVLTWSKNYTLEEMAELSASIDYFVSTPYGVAILIDHYKIPPEKCIVVLHALLDLKQLTWFSHDNFMRLHKFSVVSEWLREQSIAAGMPRVPDVTPVGINYHAFYQEPSKQLSTLGYAGAINPDNIHRHIKRPWLIEQVSKESGLYLKTAHSYHNTWITMPGFYQGVDAILVASTEEGAGLPALEASAAGKLVISTPVGLWLSKSNGTGHTVPIDETLFVSETVKLINFYKDNPTAYQEKCLSTQEHAKNYDWSCVIESWAELAK